MCSGCRSFQSRTVWGWRGKLPGTATALPVAGLIHSVPRSKPATCYPKLASFALRLPPEDQPRDLWDFLPGQSSQARAWSPGLPGSIGNRRDPRSHRPLPRGATETRSRDRVQPAAGSSGAVPHPVPRPDPRSPGRAGHRLTWQVGRAGGGKRRLAGALPASPEPSAGGGAGDSGGCGYRDRSIQLLRRRRFLPSRRASRVANRGRAEAPLAPRVSQVSSRWRRRQGRGRIPRLRASPAPRPGPT